MTTLSNYSRVPLGLSNEQRRLIEVVMQIAQTRRSEGKAVFGNARAFIDRMLVLSNEYKSRTLLWSLGQARKSRIVRVRKVASELLAALADLDEPDRNAMENVQQECFRKARSTSEGNRSWEYETTGSPYRSRGLWLQEEDLIWQIQAAGKLSQNRRKGRQPIVIEHWTATEFAAICHRSGWSPICVASSPSQGIEHSDAVRCLAAVFYAAGMPMTRSLSKAQTALKALRRPRLYEEQEMFGPNGEYYEPEVYNLNLTVMVSESTVTLRALPRFIPG